MKKATALVMLVCAVFLLYAVVGSAAEAPENMIANPGNEDGKENWSGHGNVVSDVCRTGKNCWSLAYDTVNYWIVINSQRIAVKGETEYTLTFWVKTQDVASSGATGARAMVYQFNSAGAEVRIPPERWRLHSDDIKDTADWQKVVFTFTTQPEVVEIEVQLRLQNASGTAWFDDLYLYPGPEIPGVGD